LPILDLAQCTVRNPAGICKLTDCSFNFTTRYKSTVIAVTYRKSPDTSLKPTITILASAEEITEMTSTKSFSSTPAGAQQQPTPFKTLLKLSPVAKDTYENKQDEGSHGKFGVSRQWIVDTKKEWVEKFDWYVYSRNDPKDVVVM
jgi:hypothetical protein